MAKVTEPAFTTDQIVFELERFDRSDGRLTLNGRWYGVRGRRFVRPTLTLAVAGERTRALADLEDKPWAAEDGEPWTASFQLGKGGRLAGPELSVAPDITIQLPAPGARRARPQRLTAEPRRETMTASWGPFAATAEPPALEAEPETVEPDLASAVVEAEPETGPPEPDPAALRAEIDGLRVRLAEASNAAAAASQELESARGELAELRAQLEAAQRELGGHGDELQTTRAELTAARAGRESALRSAARAEAEREAALTRAAEAEAERDALATENAQLTGTLKQSRSTVEQLNRQREEVVASRGAALVMRGATQALPSSEDHVGWVRRGLALVLLLGIVFALLIVLGAL